MSSPDEFLSTSTRALAATLAPDQPQVQSRDVTGRDLLAIFFASLFVWMLFVAVLIGFLVFYSGISFDKNSPWVALPLLALGHAIPLVIAWSRMRDRWTTAAQWGLVQFRWVYVPLGIVLGGVLAGLSDLFSPDQIGFGTGFRGDLMSTLVLGLLSAIWAPFVEEILFRGLLYRWLIQRFSIPLSVIVSALIFAAFHVGGGWVQIGFAAFVGVVFAMLFQITKTLWPGIIAHAANNFMFVLALYLGWQ